MSTNPNSKAGVGLYSPVPSTYMHTSTDVPANSSFKLTQSHAKCSGFSEVEGQWRSVQPRSRRDEAGMPATGSQADYSLHSHPEGRNCRSLARQPHQLLFHSLRQFLY